MLAEALLPRRFWAEAVTTAVYLQNRSPASVLQKTTPFEVLTGKKPCVDHLRVFGCIAYAHIPKDERQKFDPKAQKCILLGYGTEVKGYRLYNIKTKRVIYCRDVIFTENKFGLGLEKETEIQQNSRPTPLNVESDDEMIQEGFHQNAKFMPLIFMENDAEELGRDGVLHNTRGGEPAGNDIEEVH